MHSEILESVSKIKCSLLGRKGGLLYSYGHFGSEAEALNKAGKEGGKGGHNSADTSPVKQGSGKLGKAKNGTKSNAITVSLPSPAGNR